MEKCKVLFRKEIWIRKQNEDEVTDSILWFTDMFSSMLEATAPAFLADRVKLCKYFFFQLTVG